jgi:hypothetical protein
VLAAHAGGSRAIWKEPTYFLFVPTTCREADLRFLGSPFPDGEYAACEKQRLATASLEQVIVASASYRWPTEGPGRGIPR